MNPELLGMEYRCEELYDEYHGGASGPPYCEDNGEPEAWVCHLNWDSPTVLDKSVEYWGGAGPTSFLPTGPGAGRTSQDCDLLWKHPKAIENCIETYNIFEDKYGPF